MTVCLEEVVDHPTAQDLMVMLRACLAPPEWALVPQVRNAVGFAATRTADAIAVGLWPSRGCEWHGFEVKASRADWIRELRNPQKADGALSTALAGGSLPATAASSGPASCHRRGGCWCRGVGA